MSKIIDLAKFRRERNLDPLERYEKEIREFIRDVNISVDPVLTSEEGQVIIMWMSHKGNVTAMIDFNTGKVFLRVMSMKEKLHVHSEELSITHRNRWIGYLFDDNF